MSSAFLKKLITNKNVYDCSVSVKSKLMTGLKQSEALSQIMFNIALEKVLRSVQNNKL